MPDFFDRLLARSMPMGADFESVAGAVRVRPRVPGRYERAQPAFAVTEVDVEAQTSLAPGLARPVAAVVPAPAAAARPAAAPVGRPRAARMAAEPAAEQSGEPAPVETPRPGPAPHVTGVRPVERVVRERAVPAASAGLPDAAPAAVAPPAPPAVEQIVVPGPLLAPPPAVAPPGSVASTSGEPARREAARAPARSVEVRIGRIEVTAPEPAEPPASRRPGRRTPALTLERYLAGEGANR